MAEMMVRLFNKFTDADKPFVADEKLFIAKSTERGDVIVVVDDGHKWSQIERTSYNWIIIKVSAAFAKCMTMRSAEPGNAALDPYLRIIAFHFDLDLLTTLGYPIPTETEARTGYAKGSKRPTESITILEAQFDLAKLTKTKVIPAPDPAVIGDVK